MRLLVVVALLLVRPVAAPPRPPEPGGPMFEQKAANGRVIVSSDDPFFDPSVLGLGDKKTAQPPKPPAGHTRPPDTDSAAPAGLTMNAVHKTLSPLPPPPDPPAPAPDAEQEALDQEALEAEAMAEAIAAPLLGADGEDRSAPAPRAESGAGRRDDTHRGQQKGGAGRRVDRKFFIQHILPVLEIKHKHDGDELFDKFDEDKDGYLSANEQRRTRAYMREE